MSLRYFWYCQKKKEENKKSKGQKMEVVQKEWLCAWDRIKGSTVSYFGRSCGIKTGIMGGKKCQGTETKKPNELKAFQSYSHSKQFSDHMICANKK